MKTIQHLFQLNLSERESKKAKKIMALLVLPITIFYMTSVNLWLDEIMVARADTPIAGQAIAPEGVSETVKASNDEGPSETEKTEPASVEAEPASAEADASSEAAVIEKNSAQNIPAETETKNNTENQEASWKIDGNSASIRPVELDKTYKAPQNEDVTVTFTKLPDNPGSLTIKEVTLSDDQMAQLGALSDKAYDITSDMKDGTFKYDLTLPKPKDASDVQIKYAEEESQLDEAKTVDDVKVSDNKVQAEGIDHFTIYIVINEAKLSLLGSFNGANQVTVVPNASIQAKVKVELSHSELWKSTRWKVENGSWNCINTPNHQDNVNGGSAYFEEIFNITAPSSYGTYDVEFRAYTGESCGGTYASDTLHNGIIVSSCGDGVKNGSEQCDDGNEVDNDSCSNNCQFNNPVKIEAQKVVCDNESDLPNWGDGGHSIGADTAQNYVKAHPNCRLENPWDFQWAPAGGGSSGAFQTNTDSLGSPWTTFTAGNTVEINDVSSLGGRIEVREVVPTNSGQWVGFSNDNNNNVSSEFYCTGDAANYDNWEWISNPQAGQTYHCVAFNAQLDTTPPAVPTGLKRLSKDGTKEYACGDTTQLQTLIPTWNPNTDPDIDHYEYTSFNVGGSVGINEQSVYDTKYQHNWLPTIEGTYGFAVRAVDHAGNKSAWALSGESLAGSCKITYDSTVPNIPTAILVANGINIPDNGYTNSQTFTFNISSTSSDINRYQLKYWNDIPGDPYNGENHAWNPTDLHLGGHSSVLGIYNDQFTRGEGVHHFSFSACDSAGNCSSYSAPFTVTYDKTPPAVPTLISPENNAVVTGASLTNSWSSVSDAVKYIYESWHNTDTGNLANRRWEQVVNAPATSKTATNVADTTFWWRVKAIDGAGNESAWSDLWKVTVDNIAPDVDITSPAAGFVKGTVDISGTIADVNPDHYYLVVKDSHGAVVAHTNTNGSSDGVVYEASVADWNWDTTGVADGTYIIDLEARDKAGNKDSGSVKTVSVTVDNTPPTSTIDGGEDGGIVYYNSWDGIITGTAADNLSGVAGVKVSIQRGSDNEYWNGSDWVAGEVLNDASILTGVGMSSATWKYTIGLLSPDTYTVKSHAVDSATNQENTYTLTIVFDQTIPTVFLSIDPADPNGDNNWYVTIPAITLTATDDNLIDRIEYQIDSDGWLTYTAPVNILDGEHIFYYRALDLAGNYSSIGTKNVKVDTKRPDQVNNIKAKYDKKKRGVKLSWDVDDQDIDQVYIYSGKNRGFSVNSSSLVAKKDARDDTYTDTGVKIGEKYYYKFVSVDEAGNKSDTKVISIRISQGGNVTVTNEGTEPALGGSVQGAENNGNVSQFQGGNPAGPSGENNPRVLGEESSNQSENQGWKWSWWWLILLLILLAIIYGIYRRYSKDKKNK